MLKITRGLVLYTMVAQLFFYIGPRINFTLDPKAKEPLLALFFKSNNQCSSSLTTLIQK
jgi:hypothetical protein